ncbi:MAG TPA: hypothetical protein VFQ44_02330 [Streptosporangiaceae bacterium]|nr:hypothetical protein [Streptosporangiaceae bacterium]
MLADSVKRIPKDQAVAALTAQAVVREPGIEDYKTAVGRLRRYLDNHRGSRVGADSVTQILDESLPAPRPTVHAYRDGKDIGDRPLEEAIMIIVNADDFGWCLPWLGHDLVAEYFGSHYNFKAVKDRDG